MPFESVSGYFKIQNNKTIFMIYRFFNSNKSYEYHICIFLTNIGIPIFVKTFVWYSWRLIYVYYDDVMDEIMTMMKSNGQKSIMNILIFSNAFF